MVSSNLSVGSSGDMFDIRDGRRVLFATRWCGNVVLIRDMPHVNRLRLAVRRLFDAADITTHDARMAWLDLAMKILALADEGGDGSAHEYFVTGQCIPAAEAVGLSHGVLDQVLADFECSPWRGEGGGLG